MSSLTRPTIDIFPSASVFARSPVHSQSSVVKTSEVSLGLFQYPFMLYELLIRSSPIRFSSGAKISWVTPLSCFPTVPASSPVLWQCVIPPSVKPYPSRILFPHTDSNSFLFCPSSREDPLMQTFKDEMSYAPGFFARVIPMPSYCFGKPTNAVARD